MVKDDILYGVVVAVLAAVLAAPLAFDAGRQMERRQGAARVEAPAAAQSDGSRVQNVSSGETVPGEYYRGFYDACVALGIQVMGMQISDAQSRCLSSVHDAYESGWFERPSEGYVPPG